MSHVVVFPTQHGKEDIVSPIVSAQLGWSLERVDVNTDQFGTFSGEVERTLSVEDTVRAKAIAGITASGIPRALASEGSIGPHPALPMVNADLEVMIYIDLERGIEVIEREVSVDIVAVRELLGPDTDLNELLRRCGVPSHAVIVRNEGPVLTFVRKGLRTLSEVATAIDQAREHDAGLRLVVESDFRAMCSPSRQAVIAACATKLAQRIAQACPACELPGWGPTSLLRGLPCAGCGGLVPHAIRADLWACTGCGTEEVVSRERHSVEPSECPLCNP